jgi:hypothetical protein
MNRGSRFRFAGERIGSPVVSTNLCKRRLVLTVFQEPAYLGNRSSQRMLKRLRASFQP